MKMLMRKCRQMRLGKKLINEYHRDIEYCIKRTGAMKILTNVGTYFLVAGVLCLLLIKFFGV